MTIFNVQHMICTHLWVCELSEVEWDFLIIIFFHFRVLKSLLCIYPDNQMKFP